MGTVEFARDVVCPRCRGEGSLLCDGFWNVAAQGEPARMVRGCETCGGRKTVKSSHAKHGPMPRVSTRKALEHLLMHREDLRVTCGECKGDGRVHRDMPAPLSTGDCGWFPCRYCGGRGWFA